jgi:hypothetical protein
MGLTKSLEASVSQPEVSTKERTPVLASWVNKRPRSEIVGMLLTAKVPPTVAEPVSAKTWKVAEAVEVPPT